MEKTRNKRFKAYAEFLRDVKNKNEKKTNIVPIGMTVIIVILAFFTTQRL